MDYITLKIRFNSAFYRSEQHGIRLTYTPVLPLNSNICQWLWPKLLQQTLDETMEFRNGARMRKDAKKAGPSGMSRNQAYSLPEEWGGRDCLLRLDEAQLDVIREMKEQVGGASLVAFVSDAFAQIAQNAYDSLEIQRLSFENVWEVFADMHTLLKDA